MPILGNKEAAMGLTFKLLSHQTDEYGRMQRWRLPMKDGSFLRG